MFLENIALKLLLEHRAVPNWQPLLARLLADKEILAGVHLSFRDLYDKLEGSDDPSEALDTLLAELPAKKTKLIKPILRSAIHHFQEVLVHGRVRAHFR